MWATCGQFLLLHAGCDWTTMWLFFPALYLQLCFSFHICIFFFFFPSLLPAISVPFPFILARPCLFCSLRRPHASFSFSLLVFSPHPSAARRYLYVISFFLYLRLSPVFSSHPNLPHFIAYLFPSVPSPFSVLIPSVPLALIFLIFLSPRLPPCLGALPFRSLPPSLFFQSP